MTNTWASLLLLCSTILALLAETGCKELPLNRQRRQLSSVGSPILLTSSEQQKVVGAHNDIRRQEAATNMRLMEWHAGLASAARGGVEGCVWTKRTEEEIQDLVSGFQHLYEIMHVALGNISVEAITREWAGEKDSYDYDTQQCNKICTRYKQVVWAETHSVGCAIQFCPKIQNIPLGDTGGYLLACMYGPGGNVEGERPYTKGVPCRHCSEMFPYCLDGLCSKTSGVPTTTTAPDTTMDPETSSAPNLRSFLIGGYSIVIIIVLELF